MASQASQWPSGWSGWGAVLGAGEVPPQGPVTQEEPKGQTSWPPLWAWLWAKGCWCEELPAPGGLPDGCLISKDILSPSLFLCFPGTVHLPGRLRPALSTLPPLVTWQPQGSPVCFWSAGKARRMNTGRCPFWEPQQRSPCPGSACSGKT